MPALAIRVAGLACAALAFMMVYAVFAYFMAFLGNLWVEPSVDKGAVSSTLTAVAIDLCLIALFGLQHSLMARAQFKSALTKIIAPDLERSTYVHASNMALALLMWLWHPVPMVVWHVEGELGSAIIWGVFALGWMLLFVGSLMIDQLELLGLRQAFAWFQLDHHKNGKLQTLCLHGVVRHPMYFGIIMAVWATPHMTAGHLLLAIGLTGYILIALPFEERDLVRTFGKPYREYQQRMPRLIPFKWRRKG